MKSHRIPFSLWTGISIVISNIIGVGIFSTPSLVAELVPNSLAILTAWLVGAGFATLGAVSYGSLVSQFPWSGGEYKYLRTAFGPAMGFLFGWSSLVAGFSGSIAATAVVSASYLTELVAGILPAAQSTLEQSLLWIALILILLLTIFQRQSIKSGVWTQNLLVGSSMGVILSLLIGGIIFRDWDTTVWHMNAESLEVSNWLLALIPITFTFSGWNAAIYFSEEFTFSRKTILIVMLGGLAVVLVLYVLLNILFVLTLPPHMLATTLAVGKRTAFVIFGETGSIFINVGILLALLSNIGGMLMTASRVVQAMAHDGVFPVTANKTLERLSSTKASTTIVACWSCLLAVSGTFRDILLFTGFAIILFSALTVISLFVLQRKSSPPRLFFTSKIGTTASLIFILFSILLLLNLIFAEPVPSLAGFGVIICGLPLYYLTKKYTTYKNQLNATASSSRE